MYQLILLRGEQGESPSPWAAPCMNNGELRVKKVIEEKEEDRVDAKEKKNYINLLS